MDKQNMQSIKDRFYLVDFACRNQPGFRNHIINVSEVPNLIKHYNAFECYSTYFLFPAEIKKHMEYMKNRTGKATISGYPGPVYANYLPIDIDSSDLNRALMAARVLVKFLLSEYLTDHNSLLIYFSGSAGFHIMIDAGIFGKIAPYEFLHVVFAILRETFARKSRADSKVFDLSIKDKVRLLRCPNTINQKSGLYKIQLSLKDFFTLDSEQIKQKAKNPGPLFCTDRTGLIPIRQVRQKQGGIKPKPTKKAVTIYNEALEKTMRALKKAKSVCTTGTCQLKTLKSTEPGDEKNKTTITNLKNEIFCPAERAIAETGTVKGERNNAAVRLVSAIRAKGGNREKAISFIREWNEQNEFGLRLRDSELRAVVQSVYSKSICYNYGCNDDLLEKYCPYREKRTHCDDYRLFKIKTIMD